MSTTPLPKRFPPGQNLLIDADDTLWENNIYFERAIVTFISFLNHHEFTPDQVREVLYDVERESIRQHGYGMNSFAVSLVKCFEQLSVEPLTPALHDTIRGFAYAIAEHPMELLPEVAATVAELGQRHHLFCVTKGNILEQTGKFERSGLKQHFTAIEVVAEKNAPTYKAVVEKYGLIREQTWMIGNSPSSDINPALEAGLHAVFVPHTNTWMLERGEVRPDTGTGQFLQVSSFGHLRDLF
ncbi:MAG TPA: HAD hydrolase-like protein [Verrucomicrobiae bacterium]|jgi:putative hydrolase of the HAD superfamily|nr:HAD hydrolase-like protein [Verrucomicrobiae bacterium]